MTNLIQCLEAPQKFYETFFYRHTMKWFSDDPTERRELKFCVLNALGTFTPFKLGEIPVTFLHVNSSRLSVLYFQNHLLAVGWNKSEATQKDVEKTLNCCGFSHINYNGSCAAVSICCEQEHGSCAQVILLLNFLPHFLLLLEMLSQHALAIL